MGVSPARASALGIANAGAFAILRVQCMRCRDSGPASELLVLTDVQVDEHTPTRVTGTFAADERHHLPWSLVYGRLCITAIESFATLGA